MQSTRSISRSAQSALKKSTHQSAMRHLSTTTASIKNENYDVEEFHRREVLDALQTDETFRNTMAYSLAMASTEGSKFSSLTAKESAMMMNQLELSKTQLRRQYPRSMPPVYIRLSDNEETFVHEMAYSLAMATKEGSQLPSIASEETEMMKDQLKVSLQQEFRSSVNSRISSESLDGRPLPRTLVDALRPSSRAIVVTEVSRPFRVCDVNKAWENLCGYSFVESKGRSLGDLLKGPDTDPLAVTALVSQLLRGEDATTVLTNYTKSGRKFRNRLQVGPLYNDQGEISNFVGILQEVKM